MKERMKRSDKVLKTRKVKKEGILARNVSAVVVEEREKGGCVGSPRGLVEKLREMSADVKNG